MAKLSPEQTAHVEKWAAEGANLNTIQERLKAEFGITLTYLDARLLMLEIGVNLKDKPREAAPVAEPTPPVAPADAGWEDEELDTGGPAMPPAAGSAGVGLNVTVDEITPPNAMVSGKVTFSDGITASWFIDQMGRLALGGTAPGYKPPTADIPMFQRELDRLLQ